MSNFDSENASLPPTHADSPFDPAMPLGYIQAWGALIGVDAQWVIKIASANTDVFFNRHWSELLDQPLEELIGPADVERLRMIIASPHLAYSHTSRMRIFVGQMLESYTVSIHSNANNLLILEFEHPHAEKYPLEFYYQSYAAIARLNEHRSFDALCQAVADEIHHIVGYDRVMVYRFDEAGHGQVVADAHRADLDTFLGLYSPATDYPPRTRAAIVRNPVRLVADLDYTPVPLHSTSALLQKLRPASSPPRAISGNLPPPTLKLAHQNGRPSLDLSLATLRGTPLHHQANQHIEVAAMLTIAIVRNDMLWGLLTCHHLTPKYIARELRVICHMVAMTFAAQIGAIEETERARHESHLQSQLKDLLEAIDPFEHLTDGLLTYAPELMALIGADGFAVCHQNTVDPFGITPPPEIIHELVEWLRPQSVLVETHQLPALYPPIAKWAAVASGLVSISIPDNRRLMLLWFRPEKIRTVTWQHDTQEISVPDDATPFDPNTSFAQWREQVRGTASVWQPAQIKTLHDLRIGLLQMNLRRTLVESEQHEQALAMERARMQVLSDFVHNASHDLRTPLAAINTNLYLVKTLENSPDTTKRPGLIEKIQDQIDYLARIIEDMLTMSQLDQQNDMTLMPVNLNELMRGLVMKFSARAATKSQTLELELTDELTKTLGSANDLERALSKIIENALQFTPPNGTIFLRTGWQDRYNFIEIQDAGPGIPDHDLDKIFRRFYRGDTARSTRGTGMGLAITQRIIQLHGGRIEVASGDTGGAIFRVWLKMVYSNA